MAAGGGVGRTEPTGNVITNPEGDRVQVVQHTQTFKPPESAPRKERDLLRRPCMYLTSFVKSLPVCFISAIVAWSYYAYVVALVLNAMEDNVVEQVVCAVFYHLIFIMFVWSYWMTVFTPPGSVPKSWFLSETAVASLAAAVSEDEWKATLARHADDMGCRTKQRSVQGAVRYCEKCECIKPDRSHHCSMCEVCTLKMDHHCPWVNNCVGFNNYKFFILFLCYALLYCIFIATSSLRYFIQFWSDTLSIGSAKYHIVFVFLVSVLFSISISSLFWYHVYLVMSNRSTLEQFRAPIFDDNASDRDGWSLGRANNLREVFGESPLTWLLPVSTNLGDGINFPHRRAKIFTNYNSIEPSRPETPNRTLVNPILNASGTVTAAHTIHSSSTTVLNSGNASVMSGPITPSPVNPECGTEVVLDNNGHVKTIPVQGKGELTELVIQ